MTKVTVFGEQESKAEKKPIEFVYMLTTRGTIGAVNLPGSFDNVCLIGKDGDYDQIIAWNNGDISKLNYLGHWNDGVV